MDMIWDTITDQWEQYSGEIKKKWDKLTDDDLFEINGNREILASKLQVKYGIARPEANKQMAKWTAGLKP
jgi:uncharacterized protein YjbJ (UPF0337 family)